MTISDPASARFRRPTARPRTPEAPARNGPAWAEDPVPQVHIERRRPPEPVPQPEVAPRPEHGSARRPVFDQRRASSPEPAHAPAHTPASNRQWPVFEPPEELARGFSSEPEMPVARDDFDYGRDRGTAVFSQNRGLADFERARRHSRIVAFLKIGLPAGAAFTILAFLIVTFVAGGSLPSIDIGRTKIEDGKLVMENPQLNGTDSNQRPYSLTATRAIQDADRPTRISLEQIRARLPMNDESFASVTAGSGVFDADGKTLLLGDDVAVATEDGMTINLKDADIDIATGALKTDSKVTVETESAKVSADSMSVEDKGNRIVFQNRVKMTIQPPKGGTGGIGLRGLLTTPVPAIAGEVPAIAGEVPAAAGDKAADQ